MSNRVTQLFGIKYPIIQAGMVWCSGWELASAVSNAGGLGLIGAGSMTPEVLQQHIRKTKEHTQQPFGVNVPLIYSRVEESIQIIINENVPIVFTSAGNPSTWTQKLKDNGIKVVHVVSNLKFAQKSVEAGVDAIVAEGVEAGGHNGKEETTTMVLIPLLKKHINIPIIAAGGISCGRSMLAAMALGADAVQIGSRFVACNESSAHENFKNRVLQTQDGGTRLAIRQLSPVRQIRNDYSINLEELEKKNASKEEILAFIGKGKSKIGMFEGNINEGELEIGQVAAIIDTVKPAKDIIEEIIEEYNIALITFNKL